MQTHKWIFNATKVLEAIPTESPRQKWFKMKNVKPGDVILVVSSDIPQGQWPLGRILEVYPGKDGKVRTVKLQVDNKDLL